MVRGFRELLYIAGLTLTGGLLAGCVTTEPVEYAPHINLSPEEMHFRAGGKEGALDFGLSVSANESDSLENLTQLPGLRVRSVRAGSAAELAGIEAGDVLLSVNGNETNEPGALKALASASEAETFQVQARRGTTVYETEMARPRGRSGAKPRELYRVDPLRSGAGYRSLLLEEKENARSVAQVAELMPNSPLAAAGVVTGDLVLGLNGEPVGSAQGLVNALQAQSLGARVNLQVLPQSEERVRELQLTLWEPRRRLQSLAFWPLFRYRSSAPRTVEFRLVDLLLFSLFSYQREGEERTWRLMGILEFGAGQGELLEERRAER